MAKKQKVNHEAEPIEQVAATEVKPEEIIVENIKPEPVKFSEAKTVDYIFDMICELHQESEKMQIKAANELNLIPTSLQVVTNQLNICKNNIARALGK